MPCRPSTSTSRVRRPSVANAMASAAATVVLPVPPLPVTTCSRAGQRSRRGTNRAYVCCTSQTNQPLLLMTVSRSFWVDFCTLAVSSVTVVETTAWSLADDSVFSGVQLYFGLSYCRSWSLIWLILELIFLVSRAAEQTSGAAFVGSWST